MKFLRMAAILFLALFAVPGVPGASKQARIFVVDSYHREYLWSQDTHAGVCAALLEFEFLDDEKQVREYTRTDYVESAGAVVRKVWMDSKRKNTMGELAETTARISEEANKFKPDMILLGDDDAANYIGNLYVDTEIPVVFWGINGLPLKYGLIDSIEKPGKNSLTNPWRSKNIHSKYQPTGGPALVIPRGDLQLEFRRKPFIKSLRINSIPTY